MTEVTMQEVAQEPIEQVVDTAEVVEQTQDEPQAATEEMFPKKAVNAISRRDKQIGKLKAERAEIMRRMEELEARFKDIPQKSNEPQEDQFQSYTDYLKAYAKHEAAEALKNGQKQQQVDPQKAQKMAWAQERETAIATQAQDYSKNVPDFVDTLNEYGDVFDSLSPELEEMFLALDNAPAAAYNLAKSGKLESLLTMPLPLAAAMLLDAQKSPVSAPKKVTAAPQPISAAKGSGSGLKNLDELSPDELVKRLMK